MRLLKIEFEKEIIAHFYILTSVTLNEKCHVNNSSNCIKACTKIRQTQSTSGNLNWKLLSVNEDWFLASYQTDETMSEMFWNRKPRLTQFPYSIVWLDCFESYRLPWIVWFEFDLQTFFPGYKSEVFHQKFNKHWKKLWSMREI